MPDRAGEAGVEEALAGVGDGAFPREPMHESERVLVLLLVGFPGVLAEAVERRAPHRIAAATLEPAQGFTAFYRDCRVVGSEPATVDSFRIAVAVAALAAIAG